MADDTKGMANDTKRQTYHGWLFVAGLVYLGVIGGLAIWNIPDPQFKEISDLLSGKSLNDIDELIYSSEMPLAFWVCTIIVVFLLNIYYIFLENDSHIIIIINTFLIMSAVLFTLISYHHGTYDKNPFPLGGLILSLWAFSIIIVLLSVNYKWPNPNNHFANATFLVVTSFLFALLFSFPQVAIDGDHLEIEDHPVKPGAIDACRKKGPETTFEDPETTLGSTAKLIEWEHEKAVNEITERTEMDDTWYHNKFFLVGGLFGAFLAYSATFVGRSRNKDGILADDLTNHIADMFKTSLPASVLGMACVVSIGIDLHMRSNAIVTHHLGLWIAHCVEKILNVNPDIFTGWENFLRIDNNSGKGMHRDFLFGMTAAAHFYFTSVYLYVMYVSCVFFYFLPDYRRRPDAQASGASQEEEHKRRGQFRFIVFVFVLVHVTLALFVIGGNSIPSVLKIQLALWPSQWFSGGTAVVLPLALCVLVSYLTFMRLFTLYQEGVTKGVEKEGIKHPEAEKTAPDPD